MSFARFPMMPLDRVVPTPALLEVDEADLGISVPQAWQIVRHGDLGGSPLVRALFALREVRQTSRGPSPKVAVSVDDLRSTITAPGFQVLVDEPEREVVVGAIGKVWHLDIPFVHVADAAAFRAFDAPGYVKVAWALRVSPLGEGDTRVTFELRVDATDADAWSKFRRYFALIGPASRLIRRSVLSSLMRAHGTAEAREKERPLPGDTVLRDATDQTTQGTTIAATPEAIWPWLVQMGCGRAGFYAADALDNDGARSAREIHPELQRLRVGDIVPSSSEGDSGVEVLVFDPPRTLVLGTLYDAGARRQLPFGADRPERYWQVTWSFVLEPLNGGSTRLHVRARTAFSSRSQLSPEWIRPVHRMMQSVQLRHLAARIENREPRSDTADVLEGVGGAAVMVAAFLTPFMRDARSHWGVDAATAARELPGDDLVPHPQWGWTHGIEIAAPAIEIWPWLAQLGADRGGFYSYQWLENVAGCELRNAEALHPSWTLEVGDALVLHPKMPPLRIAAMEPGRFFVVRTPSEPRIDGKPWTEASWLFFVEPLDEQRSRLISRYRCAASEELATRLAFGPALLEPVGFAMDRRMLLGVKARVEKKRATRPLRSVARRGDRAQKH